jgi:hypothetical protein
MLYSYKNQYPTGIPYRIVMPNGNTRTDPSSFTEEEIQEAGYVQVDNPPSADTNQVVEWTGYEWQVRNKTEEEIFNEHTNMWISIRLTRDKLLKDLDWRYLRYQSQTRLGLQTTDDIHDLDVYAQALRDITTASDPTEIIWPTL